MVVDIGERILELIDINSKIWHRATRLKDFNNIRRTDVDITPTERVDHFLKVRRLNAQRSAIRWEIDKHFGGANESKVGYKEEE